MFYFRMLVFIAASAKASMIVRTPVSIQCQQKTELIATTLTQSRTLIRTTLRSGSLSMIQESKKSAEFPGNRSKADSYISRMRFGPKASEPGFLRKKFPALSWHLLPNWLTYCRCVAIPMLVVFFYSARNNIVPCGIFAVASATDYLDGYLARRWDITSDFGAFLDPVADKLTVSTALILLAGRYGAVVAIPTCIILAREIAVSALREWMAGKGLRDVVQVGFQGKLKTASTMLSVTLLLLVPTAGVSVWTNLQAISLILLYVSMLITLSSGSVYFRAAGPLLVKDRNVDR